MDTYLDRIGIKKAITLAIIVLAGESFAVWFVKSSIISGSKTLFYLTLFLSMLNLVVLMETAFIIRRITKMLGSKFLVGSLLFTLTVQAKKSQQNEARYRLSRLAAANLYKLLHIKKV